MRVDAFDFELPERLIALRPVKPRDAARLLVVDPTRDGLDDRGVGDLPGLLRAGDLLVVNDTRVIRAALRGVRAQRDARSMDVAVDVNLHKRIDGSRWRAFARPGKRLKPGDVLRFDGGLSAKVEEKSEAGDISLAFDRSGAALDGAIFEAGAPPLPPYIAEKRDVDEADAEDYQTVFADAMGSVAAPTAGLHFTPALLSALRACGVEIVRVTLHVGAGTFLPVKAQDTEDHVMHAEWRSLDMETCTAINCAKARGGRIVAVGTTALRTLESSVDETGALAPRVGETDIFITPGYRFKLVDGLITNFHLPRSTLFMLVSAFCGLERMHAAYAHAIAHSYRFYSYGDASLLWRADG
jgi:S-adenosylmethionine:tRNA ribosyltransferase-isomerase